MKYEPGRRFLIEDYLNNKRVVIYGGGATGQILYNQLLKKSINVVAVLDKNAECLQNIFSCPLIKPEDLLRNISFDYIILASALIVSRREMKDCLTKNGVDESQICSLRETFYDGEREYQIWNDSKQMLNQLIQANENMKENFELTVQFQWWMQWYYDNLTDPSGYIESIKEIFKQHDSVETRIMLGLYLFQLKELDVFGMKQLVNDILKLPEKQYEWGYYLCSRYLCYMEHEQEKILYKGLGADRKKMWKKLADYYFPTDKLSAVMCEREEGKVAILIQYLVGPNHSPSIVCRMIAEALYSLDKKVKIFVVLAFTKQKSYGFMSAESASWYKDSCAWVEFNRQEVSPQIEIEYIAEDDLSKLAGKVIDSVLAFRPQSIIDVTDEASFASPILWKYYPILNYALRPCTSGTFFEKTTVGVFEYNKEIESYHVDVPMIPIFKSATVSYNKKDRLGIPEKSFVIITVGNRIYTEIKQELVDYVVNMMKRNTDMYWLLVGDMRVSKYFSGKEEVCDRIQIISYEEDLVALYKLCDVFLNPDRLGGGISMRLAMQNEVVVAALKKDIQGGARCVGESELINGGYRELCGYIEKLFKSSTMLAKKKKEMKRIIEKKYDIKKWASALCGILDDMEKSFVAKERGHYVG